MSNDAFAQYNPHHRSTTNTNQEASINSCTITTMTSTTITSKHVDFSMPNNAPTIPTPSSLSPPLAACANQLTVDQIMPEIYLTKNFMCWNEDNLRVHGFTHIIIIDKHIQELYYPSPIFKLFTDTDDSAHLDPFDLHTHDYCQPSTPGLNFGKQFKAIDLNFGEKSYLTTVLPNCYRAVKFISTALQSGGRVLVIDCNGGEQKCLTIVVAYLMFKHNLSFNAAFVRLKVSYQKADLDRFYASQLYEYEPILKTQRAHSRGHSSSRGMRDSYSIGLKRKQGEDTFLSSSCSHTTTKTSSLATNRLDFINNFNPLEHFNFSAREKLRTNHEQQEKFEGEENWKFLLNFNNNNNNNNYNNAFNAQQKEQQQRFCRAQLNQQVLKNFNVFMNEDCVME